MKKILSLSLLFLLVFLGLVATAIAADCDYEIHCDVDCQRTVTVGNPLNVTVTAYNHGYSSVSLSRSMIGLVGNTGSTVQNVGIYGPFNKNFATPWDIPPGSSVTRQGVRIIDAVPSELGGKIAMATFIFITSKGCAIGGGMCLVQVLPATP